MQQVYLNGEYLAEQDAKISIFDRAVLFADAVYEVTSIVAGKLFAFDGHMQRLQNSINELHMNIIVDSKKLLEIHRQLIARNNLTEGLIYLQYSRGNPQTRDFEYPTNDIAPTLFLFVQKKQVLDTAAQRHGIKIISLADLRWQRRDIKTTQLLFPSLAKMRAKQKNADDAWLVEDGFVTEGTSNNAHIIKDGAIITRPLSYNILHGITRQAILAVARSLQMKVIERPFTISEAQQADEAFSTSASGFANPVIEIDGVKIGDGTPGPVVEKLRTIYIETHMKTAL